MYPVDLPSGGDSELTSASIKYLSSLESEPADSDWFILPSKSKVAITACNIKQLQLFNDKPECILLTLHKPDEPQKVVALHLCGNWWHVDDVLRTSNKSRNGLEVVKCTIERVLMLVLSQLVDRSLGDEQLFSNHRPTENCKLFWTYGEAVGFYSFKHKAIETPIMNKCYREMVKVILWNVPSKAMTSPWKKAGSLCENCISQCYELPVLDTIFVRSHCRRRGFGLLMLQDFCDMFPNEDVLGVSSPLSVSMVAVCKKFLMQHKEHRDVLYEVEAPGSWIQRRNIWLNIQLGRYSQSKNSPSSVEVEKDEGSNQL